MQFAKRFLSQFTSLIVTSLIVTILSCFDRVIFKGYLPFHNKQLSKWARLVNPHMDKGGWLQGMDYYWVTEQAEYASDVIFVSAVEVVQAVRLQVLQANAEAQQECRGDATIQVRYSDFELFSRLIPINDNRSSALMVCGIGLSACHLCGLRFFRRGC